MTQFAVWVIQNDAIICQDGLPFVLQLDALPDDAVRLGFGDVDLANLPHLSDLDLPDVNLPSHAIDVDTAIQIGALHAFGTSFISKTAKDLSAISFRALCLDERMLSHISRAIQLVLWQRDHRFCSRCGGRTQTHAKELAKVCPACRHHAYPRVQPCIITAIVRTDGDVPQILLAQHRRHKNTGMYGLIAGYIEAGETMEAAVARETLEEVGIRVANIRYFGSQAWPYPSNLMLGVLADYHSGEITPCADEIDQAQFFALDALPLIPKAGTIAHALICEVIRRYAPHLPLPTQTI